MPNINFAHRFGMPAWLARVDALPPLLPELQYRIVGDEPVLVDIHASLIIDVFPHALIDTTARNSRPQGDVR